jgi:hypothetical protein
VPPLAGDIEVAAGDDRATRSARLDPRDAARGRPIRYYDIDEDEEPRAEYPSFTVWLLTEMRRRRR